MNDGFHMHVIFVWDQIQEGLLVAILLLKYVPKNLSDMHGPILFKLSTSTEHDGIHMSLTLFCDLIQEADW